MRRAALLILAGGALLLTPGASGVPDVDGDPTPPVVTPVITGTLGALGWYTTNVTVNWTVVDPESIILSTTGCDARTLTADTTGTQLTCSAESDGGTTTVGKTFKLDKTAPAASAQPSRTPDANGWYNHDLTVEFIGSDGTSGLESCSAAQTYDGPDTSGTSVTGTCRDRAGNTRPASLPLKYDETVPQASPAARPPDANGWYNHAVTVAFQGADATAGVDSCTQLTYAGPDDSSVALSGTCLDRAGNQSASALFTLAYDETAPQASASASRGSDVNGWYNRPLEITFAGSDATSGLASCDAPKTYSSPDSKSTSVSGECRDQAGNVAQRSFAFKYDRTPPQVAATPKRPPNANEWYNAPLEVSFSGTDPISGVVSCSAAKSYPGPGEGDDETAALAGTCVDEAGNLGSTSFGFKYDATAPTATATARAPDANGWYTAPLMITFAGNDATSGIASCDAPATYSSPDSKSTSLSGGCRDRAGNASPQTTFGFKYDATAPTATAVFSRPPNPNGWFNAPLTVTFSGTDATSGLNTCPEPQGYGGPDSAAAVVSGTCIDNAGNGTLASLVVRYDATAPAASAIPSRQPDTNEWYNAPLEVSFAATDALSGPDSCTAPRSYSTPDSPDASLAGSCRDRAGNESAQAAFAFKYDATAPEMTSAVPVRPPDRAGWYNRPVVVDAEGSDATSGLASCPSVTYTGPDGDDAPIAGTCLDRAGNVGFKWFSIDYDGTPPEATAAVGRGPDANGWYNRALTVRFAGSDRVSGLESCASPESYDGPDTSSAVISGICLDKAGNAAVASYDLHYDATPPQVTGVTPERQPDAAGWYNHPLAVSFHGSDATSGIDACTQASYAGPDSSAAAVTGACSDRAGNGSASASFALRYDTTGPTLTAVAAKPGNRTAALSWTASSDTALVKVRRGSRLVYQGSDDRFTDTGLQNGVRYRYTVTGYDVARNAATAEVAATPTAPLVAPAAGARVTAPPRLVWTAVPKATYYNVQLWRRGRILSAWPAGTALRLRRTWTYAGRRHRLLPGRYRWYVWPGYGRKATKRFGPLLGSSSFVVR